MRCAAFLAAGLLLASPAAAGDKDDAPRPAAGTAFSEVVLPIMEARCTACHGEAKKKGGLDLSGIAGWKKGGVSGAAFVAGKPEESLLFQRIRLPLDDEEHMAPRGKPQCTEAEIVALTWWIKAGASFDAKVPPIAPAEVLAIARGKPKPAVAAPVAPVPPPVAAVPPKPVDPAAVAALRATQVAVQPVAQGENLLVVDYAGAAAATGDADLQLLAPLAEQTAQLSLARSKVTDAGLAALAGFANLETLDLRNTAVGDAGLPAIARLGRLTSLNLSSTKVSDAGLATLARIPALRKVYLWNSGVSKAGVAAFRAANPRIKVDFGDGPGMEVKAPKIANTVCPVGGKPVDPAFTSTFEGRTIGFCCGKCKATFDAKPASFKGKIK